MVTRQPKDFFLLLLLYHPYLSQYYGRSGQCGRPVGARCSIGLGRNPLINDLIQHTFKLNFLCLEKFTVIPFRLDETFSC